MIKRMVNLQYNDSSTEMRREGTEYKDVDSLIINCPCSFAHNIQEFTRICF